MTAIKRKRSNTKLGTIEKQYGPDFDIEANTRKLSNYFKEQGFPSLSKFFGATKKRKK